MGVRVAGGIDARRAPKAQWDAGTAPMKLDAADRKILRLLQENGRITNQEMALQCNLSPSACHERFKRLKDDGYIVGFSAILNAEKLRRNFVVFAQVQLRANGADQTQAFADAVSRFQEVAEVYQITGPHDFLLRIQVADMQAYKTFLGQLMQLPAVLDVRSLPVLDRIKHDPNLPV